MIILNFIRRLNQNNCVLDFGQAEIKRYRLPLKAVLRFGVVVRIRATLPQPTARLKLDYHANVFRGLDVSAFERMQVSARFTYSNSQHFETTKTAKSYIDSAWQVAARVGIGRCDGFGGMTVKKYHHCHIAQIGKRISNQASGRMVNLVFVPKSWCECEQVARLTAYGVDDAYYNLPRVALPHAHTAQVARQVGIGVLDKAMAAVVYKVASCHHAQTAMMPPVQHLIIIDNSKPEFKRYILNFECLIDETNRILNFGRLCQGIRRYNGAVVIVNEVSLEIDGKSMDCFGLSVAIDNHSYAWSMSANIARHHLPDVNIFDGFKTAVVNINGQRWRFLVDSVSDNQAFGTNSLTLQGKSRAVILSEPFAMAQSALSNSVITAQQLAHDELNRNSIPSGFTIDWQMTDWLITQYSYLDKTPINVLTWIAQTAGGFINAHPYDDVIIVKANYPYPRWELPTPNITIPPSLISELSTTRTPTPNYNGVYVSGVHHGVSMLIKRRGTNGGYRGVMVTHELITDNTVARVRGIHELSSVGDRVNAMVNMPMHRDVGLLLPSDLVAVGGMTGYVRSTNINVGVQGNGALTIVQSVNVEI